MNVKNIHSSKFIGIVSHAPCEMIVNLFFMVFHFDPQATERGTVRNWERKIDTITKSCWLSFHCLYLITQSPISFSFQSIHPFALDYMIITNRMYVHRRTIASKKNKLRLLINWLCVYAFLALKPFISLLPWWWNEEEWRR